MEPILLILAVSYMVSGKHSKDTSLAAYKAGKEPPGLVKARLRHERGGGRFVTRPGKEKKTPKGPGATRLLIASRWSVVCEKAKTKGEDKLRRWQAWYDEQAPDRDKVWRDKQQKKINNRAERLQKWQGRWTAVKDTAAAAKDTAKNAAAQAKSWGADETDAHAGIAGEDTQQQPSAQTESAGADTADPPEPAAGTATDDTAGAAPSQPSTNTSTGSGDIVDYQQAAAALRAAAERIEQYRNDLSAMADGLGGKQWGAEVHGDIHGMDTNLQEIAADYRDMAGQMQQEGDNVADAENAHPYVPGPEVVNA